MIKERDAEQEVNHTRALVRATNPGEKSGTRRIISHHGAAAAYARRG